MDLRVSDKRLDSVADKAYKTFAAANPVAFDSMRNDVVNLSIGVPDIDPAAVQNPIYVGDSNAGRTIGMTAQMEALLKSGNAGMRYNFNGSKWDIQLAAAKAKGVAGDSLYDVMGGMAMDAAGVLTAGSLLSPNSINWITEVFKKPLSWSRASDLVKIQAGNNPWAVTQAMAGITPSGWGAVNSAGDGGNTMSQDVEAKLDMLTQQIINIDVTYKLTFEELERAKSQGDFPLAGQVISYKQAYAKYISDIIRDGLIYYGNTATGNAGLFSIDSITGWTSISGNQALATIQADGTNTAKGSKIYQQFAAAARSFLNPLKNNLSKFHATMSVEAFNMFTSVPYSDVYNPSNPMQIFGQSFDAGGKKVVTGSIGGIPFEIGCDPMLSGSGYGNFFNSQTYDYLVFTADELAANPTNEAQSLLHYGQPLADLVYPVIPQQFSTQYRYLKRVSGVFAPYKGAVKVYSGYGYAS